MPKKDLGLIAMGYGNIYVAKVAFGAKDTQTVKAFLEAESYDGPALIIAYSHCIAHGYDLARGLDQQKLAVDTAYWPLYRYDPRLPVEGKNPLQLDSAAPKSKLVQFEQNEARFRMIEQQNPERYKALMAASEKELADRFKLYEVMAKGGQAAAPAAPAAPAKN